MEAIEFLKIHKEMCESESPCKVCKDCEICLYDMLENPEERIEIVERWKESHDSAETLVDSATSSVN